MKLFGYHLNISKQKRVTSLQNPAAWLLQALGGQTKAKISVTDEKALSLSAFHQGVRIISEAIAGLPLGVYEKVGDNNFRRAKEHPVDFVGTEPSHFYTSYKFRETMQAIATVRGNAYALIFRDNGERARELRILNPHNVKQFLSGEDVWYKILGIQNPVNQKDVIHISGLGFLNFIMNDVNYPGLKGQNPILTSRESLAVAIASQELEGSLFGNGAMLQGFLTSPNVFNKDQQKNIVDSWKNLYSGFANAGKTPFLQNGLEYKRIALTPQEMLLIESRKFGVEEVSRILNIPLHKLNALDRATNNNIEVLSRDFYLQTLRPWAENWEAELNRKLFTKADKKRFGWRFDFSELLRGDSKTQAELIRSLFNNGIININDGRKMLGLNSINDEFAKTHWIQLNMAPANQRPPLSIPVNQQKNRKMNGKQEILQ